MEETSGVILLSEESVYLNNKKVVHTIIEKINDSPKGKKKFLILWKGKEAEIISQKVVVIIMLSDVSEKEVLKEELTKRDFYRDDYVFKRVMVGLNDKVNQNKSVWKDLEKDLQCEEFCLIF